jgi:predicted Rossmann fold nucleotide-binding protein DprA/Smf involved in DNA uptake
VPGRVTSTLARGTNNLLKDGAAPISDTEDVLDELFGVGVRKAQEVREPRPAPADAFLRSVLESVEGNHSVEAVAHETGGTVAETRAALGRLEAEGYLVRLDLGGWERTGR